jgi:hypothetical protein
MSLQASVRFVGPPVEWNSCLTCGRTLTESDDRYGAEKDGIRGVNCQSCHQGGGAQ